MAKGEFDGAIAVAAVVEKRQVFLVAVCCQLIVGEAIALSSPEHRNADEAVAGYLLLPSRPGDGHAGRLQPRKVCHEIHGLRRSYWMTSTVVKPVDPKLIHRLAQKRQIERWIVIAPEGEELGPMVGEWRVNHREPGSRLIPANNSIPVQVQPGLNAHARS